MRMVLAMIKASFFPSLKVLGMAIQNCTYLCHSSTTQVGKAVLCSSPILSFSHTALIIEVVHGIFGHYVYNFQPLLTRAEVGEIGTLINSEMHFLTPRILILIWQCVSSFRVALGVCIIALSNAGVQDWSDTLLQPGQGSQSLWLRTSSQGLVRCGPMVQRQQRKREHWSIHYLHCLRASDFPLPCSCGTSVMLDSGHVVLTSRHYMHFNSH